MRLRRILRNLGKLGKRRALRRISKKKIAVKKEEQKSKSLLQLHSQKWAEYRHAEAQFAKASHGGGRALRDARANTRKLYMEYLKLDILYKKQVLKAERERAGFDEARESLRAMVVKGRKIR